MESFYGGKQGASVVIKARFKYITSDKDAQDKYIDPYYQVAYNNILETTDPESVERTTALAQLSKETMTDCLKDINYKDVWYHEYCIIDHPNKNNKNNGKLYRRTLKKSDDEVAVGGVAEYIGQIVGPAGSAPQLADVTGVDNLKQNMQNAINHLQTDDILSYQDEQGNVVIFDPNVVNPPMGIQNFGEDINYIPGNTCAHINVSELQDISWCIESQSIEEHRQDGEIQQVYICKDCGSIKIQSATIGNCPSCSEAEQRKWTKYWNQWVNPTIFLPWDVIQEDNIYTHEYNYSNLNVNIQQYIQHGSYGWYNLRKGTDEQDVSLVYLGLDIPYHIDEFEGLTLPYTSDVQVVKTINTQGVLAPYYEKYSIQVPRGITGAWVDNLRWEKTSVATEYNQFSEIIYNRPTSNNNYVDSWSVGTNKASVAADTTIWLADFHWVDNQGASHSLENLYLGLYKNIKNIDLSNDGTLTIYYSDGSNADSFPKKINWISSASVDNSDNLKINFNNNNITNINHNLKTITGINLTTSGVLSFNRSNNTTNTVTPAIQWIDNVQVITPTSNAADAGFLKVHFNTSPANQYIVNQNLNIYKSIDYQPDTGLLSLENTNPALNLSKTIRTVQEGLFVESKNYQVTVSATADFDTIETAINNYLNGLNNSSTQEPDKTRAQIVTVIKGSGSSAETEKAIAYWNTLGNRWEILGDTTAGGGGSGSGAALDPDNTHIRYDLKSMLLKTAPLSITGTISDPWNAQSVSINV